MKDWTIIILVIVVSAIGAMFATDQSKVYSRAFKDGSTVGYRDGYIQGVEDAYKTSNIEKSTSPTSR